MKKKVVSVLLAAAMTTTLVAGCGSTGAADTAADTSAEETTESTDDTEADAADAEETANAGCYLQSSSCKTDGSCITG